MFTKKEKKQPEKKKNPAVYRPSRSLSDHSEEIEGAGVNLSKHSKKNNYIYIHI